MFAETAIGFKMNGEEAKSVVEDIVKESDDLITALESVAAMYGIPASGILVDDSINKIKVVNENIIAPSNVKAHGNTKAIMCAIGSVLDYISQRIDDKLTTYHHDTIQKCKIEDSVRRDANPSKGKVVGHYADDNGDEIIVYDTGLVDMANTKEACRKVDELRRDMKIPEYNPPENKPSYFTDEDDITMNVDMNEAGMEEITPDSTVDISENIQESSLYIDMIEKMNYTTNLGYDLLSSQGFDFVKPINSFVQESDNVDTKKSITVADIKYMKFDNSNIIKAIKYFNDARSEQSEAKKGELDIRKFINSENYKKAIDCLNKQFDARINVRFFQTGMDISQLYTSIWNNIKNNLTISKTKGFQLNGLPIDIFVFDKSLDEDAPDDISLFGQNVASTFCHEIFHNISCVLRESSIHSLSTLNITLSLAAGAKSGRKRRIIISNYVNTIDSIGGKKLNRLSKRMLVKQLAVLASIQNDPAAMNDFKKSFEDISGNMADKDIEYLISRYKKIIRRRSPKGTRYIAPAITLAISIITTILHPWAGLANKAVRIGACALSWGLLGSSAGYIITRGIVDMTLAGLKSKYKKEKDYEEFYSDLFAAMYNLPVTFFIGLRGRGSSHMHTPNSISLEKLNELAKLEKEVHETVFSPYPSMMERNHASVKVAKNILDSDTGVDPSIKKYLEWIVANFSSTLDTDIEEIYNQTTFDPKTADDLDKHLESLITDNNVTLTESFIEWLVDDTMYVE